MHSNAYLLTYTTKLQKKQMFSQICEILQCVCDIHIMKTNAMQLGYK